MPRTLPTIVQLPPTTLTDLPDDLIRPNNGSESSIGNYLTVQALCRLSCVCKSLRDALKEDVKKIKLISLLTHIVNADLANAEIMIKKDPGLLIEEGQVTQKIDEQTSYCYKGTALSIALELGDLSIYPDHHEEMADMICRHLRTLPNGEAEIKKQIQTHFPHGLIPVTPYDFTEICKAIQISAEADAKAALNKEQNDTPLCQALNKFRTEFSTCSRNLCHFAAVVTVYETEYNRFKNWDQRELFCKQVIGFIQRYLPLCDIYAVKQGIYNIVENKQRLKRDGFEFDDWITPGVNGSRKMQVFLLLGVVGLGFDFVCVGVGVDAWRGGPWKTYVEQKQSAWRTLYERVCSSIQHPRNIEGAASCSNTTLMP